ncbi:SLBB domain-containing protein [Paucibacter sp. APW11]|uniref:SLBB domain-containing protein n=1 Tax=Roseateles aquae TaxID=3077235 RepID=A0ABU3PFC3_9BURK|nr:SLBB domain-containing protein [Paucibacter sp. APW11]MDT9001269.1 SLBB domain-containing protein [Paucibacter sp. APW11]
MRRQELNNAAPQQTAALPRLSGRSGTVFLSLTLAAMLIGTVDVAIAQSSYGSSSDSETAPIRLKNDQRSKSRNDEQDLDDDNADRRNRDDSRPRDTRDLRDSRPRDENGRLIERSRRYQASEFETYVQKSVGELENGAPEVRRFGSELMLSAKNNSVETNGLVPADYILSIGDEVLLTIWGSVEADLRLTVDRAGRITIPKVGPVMVAGVSYGDLNSVIDTRMKSMFRNYKLSTSLGRLRNIRVYVTGFTGKPGAYTVSSLSTIVNAVVQAGGPSAAGSFRRVELRRGGRLISTLDFYDLLVKGDKTADRILQAEDVIHIGAVGPQIGLIGSVNRMGIFELKPGETVEDILQMAGGLSAVADKGRMTIERLESRLDNKVENLSLPEHLRRQPRNGDLLRAYSLVNVSAPQFRQNKRIRIEGEVLRPGEYLLPPKSSLADAIAAAGGLTPQAYIFGTEFARESVRITQQENYERALRDLETEFTRAATTQKALSADEAATQTARVGSSGKLIERLRAVRPTGRIVLQLQPNATELPNLEIEDGDRLSIPPRPTSIGVFGSVFNAGSYLYADGTALGDFIRLAGGLTRGADERSLFVLRANGSVLSARQKSQGWLFAGNGIESSSALPGDTIFVPEELNKTSFAQEAKEWTQILYQFGIGAAALKTLKN